MSTQSMTTLKIGLWGTRGAGKTTFILMLTKTLNSMNPAWLIKTADDVSEKWLLAAREQLDERRSFVEKTKDSGKYTFNISERVSGSTSYKPRFQLIMYDEPGELYEVRPVKPPDNKQEEVAVPVEQRSGAHGQASKTPWQAFQTLMDCDALLILLDPGWSVDKRSYHGMVADLLSDIDKHYQEAQAEIDPDQRKTPVLAFCVSKIDGGRLLGAANRDPKNMWQAKNKQPKPAFVPSTTDDETCFLFHDRLPATQQRQNPYQPCDNQCLVFHMLGRMFFEEHIRKYVRLGWEIACFPISAIGTLTSQPDQTATPAQAKSPDDEQEETSDEIRRVIPSGDWQRELTPPPPAYQVITRKAGKMPKGLSIEPGRDTTKDQAFYRRRLVETDAPYEPWRLFEPIHWAYERVIARTNGKPQSNT